MYECECALLLGGLNSKSSGNRSNFIRLNRLFPIGRSRQPNYEFINLLKRHFNQIPKKLQFLFTLLDF